MAPLAARSFSLPSWLGGRSVGWTTVFAGLFLFTTSCRTIIISIIPIKAFSYLGNAQAVSVLFFAASTIGVCSSVLMPVLLRRIGARGVFYAAALAGLLGPVLLGLPSFTSFLLGMAAWVFSTLAFEVSTSLYVMHHIRRRDLGSFEPKRIFFMVISYSTGPWLGLYLETRVSHWTPFILTMVVAVATVAYFHMIGLRQAGGQDRYSRPASPMRSVRRYLAQPRLRLAWVLALARSAWWATFFIYVPIYAVTMGLGEMAGGALVSAGVAMVFTVMFWGRIGRKYGFRRLLMAGFATSGIASIAAFLLADSPWVGGLVLVITALCTASIDGAGNVPFFRAVRPFEREQMTGVFSTYRDMSQLLPPALFAVLLLFLPVHAVFGVAGLWMLCVAWLCRYIPRRL